MEKSKLLKQNRKIVEGLELSGKQLLEEKKRTNSQLAVYLDGKVQVLNARDIPTEKP